MQCKFTASVTSMCDYIHMQKTFTNAQKKWERKKKISDNCYVVLSQNQNEHFVVHILK